MTVYNFTLDGSKSYDPDEKDNKAFVYKWQCRVFSEEKYVKSSIRARSKRNNTEYDGSFCLQKGEQLSLDIVNFVNHCVELRPYFL